MKTLTLILFTIIAKDVPFYKRCTYEYLDSSQCKRASINKSEYCKKHYHKY